LGVSILRGGLPGSILQADPGPGLEENETGKTDAVERILTIRTPQPSVIAGRFYSPLVNCVLLRIPNFFLDLGLNNFE
jgi:hypothetical protein